MVDKYVLQGRELVLDPGEYWVGERFYASADYDALAADLAKASSELFAYANSVNTLNARVAALESALRRIVTDGDYTAPEGMKAMARSALETVSTMDHGGVGQVGCENPDGTLTVHGENETCAVCSSLETAEEHVFDGGCPCALCTDVRAKLETNLREIEAKGWCPACQEWHGDCSSKTKGEGQ